MGNYTDTACGAKHKTYPKTAVICNRKTGGAHDGAMDAEAEFDSPETIEAIRRVLESRGVDAVSIEADENLAENLKREKIEFAFNLAEGRYGRDREAQVPALLGLLGIPYMGGDALVMSVTLDKDICKRFLSTYGIRTAKGIVIHPEDGCSPDVSGMKFPLLVKPNAEGSGRGILEKSVAADKDELSAILERCFASYRQDMLAEEYLPGREFTVALLGNGKNLHVFSPMEIIYRVPADDGYNVYNYSVKKNYLDYVDYKCPADIPAEVSERMMHDARTAFLALGCRDVARVDFRMDADGEPCFLELNPLPGLAPGYSDFPMAAESEGYTFDDVVFAIYEAALERTYNAR